MFESAFAEVAALLRAAALIGALALWLRQPLIIAFILVGILEGPAVLGWVTAADQIDLLAKIGIALLLFYPNVDFYSGIIYQAMGFPVEMFPVLFAIPRTAGWLAQWEELLQDLEQRINRPRQIYDGCDARGYVPLPDRRMVAAEAQRAPTDEGGSPPATGCPGGGTLSNLREGGCGFNAGAASRGLPAGGPRVLGPVAAGQARLHD